MIAPSRTLAFRILLDVEKGGFAADLLAQQSAPLSSRDAGLAATIVLGVLRVRAQLDFIIGRLSGKPVTKLDSEVLAALRMGIYQLRYLDRIPPHAAVSESVDLVKRGPKRSAAGLVNAILRKAGDLEVEWPDRATALSCPEWLLGRWERQFGTEAAEGIAAQALEIPRRYAYVPGSGCLELEHGQEPPAGARIQDIGSQSIVPLLEANPTHRVLDLCAAPGNKTAQLKDSGAWTVAADVSYSRLQTVPEPKLVLDARRPLPFLASFDRILVDAPCSGTGTILHNPEIKWRVVKPDFIRHFHTQCTILENALAALKPGGRLVYSTCSLEPEENERVVETVASSRVLRTLRRLPGRDPGDGFFAAILE